MYWFCGVQHKSQSHCRDGGSKLLAFRPNPSIQTFTRCVRAFETQLRLISKWRENIWDGNFGGTCLHHVKAIKTTSKFNGLTRSSPYFHHIFEPGAPLVQELRAEIQELHRRRKRRPTHRMWLGRTGRWTQLGHTGGWVGEIWVKRFVPQDFGVPNSFRPSTWQAVPKAESSAPPTGALGWLPQSTLTSCIAWNRKPATTLSGKS